MAGLWHPKSKANGRHILSPLAGRKSRGTLSACGLGCLIMSAGPRREIVCEYHHVVDPTHHRTAQAAHPTRRHPVSFFAASIVC